MIESRSKDFFFILMYLVLRLKRKENLTKLVMKKVQNLVYYAAVAVIRMQSTLEINKRN